MLHGALVSYSRPMLCIHNVEYIVLHLVWCVLHLCGLCLLGVSRQQIAAPGCQNTPCAVVLKLCDGQCCVCNNRDGCTTSTLMCACVSAGLAVDSCSGSLVVFPFIITLRS